MSNSMREQLALVRTEATQVSEIDALKAHIAALEAKLSEQPGKKPRGAPSISFKVSQKGAVSAYGLGRFPVTLYARQWERLLNPEVLARMAAFIEANKATIMLEKGQAPGNVSSNAA